MKELMRKSTGRSYFRSPREQLVWIISRRNDEIVAVFSNEVMAKVYVEQQEEDLRVDYREVCVWLGPCAKCERYVGEHVFGDGCPFFEVSKTRYQKKRYSKPKVGPGTYLTAAQDLGEAVEECKQAIIEALRLDWLCEKLNNLILAAQKATEDTLEWNRICRDLDDMGIEIRKPTFNAYLREFHGIGRQKEKGNADDA